jgi:hypothetical protein
VDAQSLAGYVARGGERLANDGVDLLDLRAARSEHDGIRTRLEEGRDVVAYEAIDGLFW